MTFSQQTQAPGCAPPGTPVLPMLLRVGDDWPVPIVLADGLGNPRDLTGALVTARLFCPFPIDLAGQGGSIVVTNATEGQLTVTVFSVTTDRVVPQTTMARAYPCRLSLTVTDTLGLKHTYDPIPILPLQPQDDAPAPVQGQTQLLSAYQQGPAGASNITLQQVNALIAAAMAAIPAPPSGGTTIATALTGAVPGAGALAGAVTTQGPGADALAGTVPGAASLAGTPTEAAPPVNTARPAVTGTTQVGQTLTCSNGTWTNSPTSYVYLWNGQAPNVTSQTYVPTSDDIGSTLHCRVTATTASGGMGVATSPDTSTFVIDKPAAPTITGLSSSSGQNSISFTDASNNGSAITSHNLYRSTTSGFTPAAGNLVANFSGSGPYADTGLTNGTTYYYRLTAVNGAGEGAQSLQQSGTPATAATSALSGTVPGQATLTGAQTNTASGTTALMGSVPGAATLAGTPTETAPGSDALVGAVPASAVLGGGMTATPAQASQTGTAFDFSNSNNSALLGALAA